jgi:C1A family cysteine protease
LKLKVFFIEIPMHLVCVLLLSKLFTLKIKNPEGTITMRQTNSASKKGAFIFTFCLFLLAGGIKPSLGWELNNAHKTKEYHHTVISDHHTPLPALEEIRRGIKEKGYNFTVGETWVYNLTPEERKKMFRPISFTIDESRLKKSSPLENPPSSFDWRDSDVVTPVKEQTPCNTCWAFAAIAEIESKILINEGISFDFSEQNLVSCDFYASSGKLESCSQGGSPFRSTNFFTQRGPSLESCAPYQEEDGVPCDDTCDIIKNIDGWQLIANDIDSIKTVLYRYGPLETAMDASAPEFGAYTGGVFESYGLIINHVVLIVGWDDSLGRNGAWIVKNSWGTDWGMDGYFYIAYGASKIGAMSCYTTSYKDYDSNESIMYYDEGGFAYFDNQGSVIDTSGIGAGSPTAWCAAVFTPTITGTLKAVDFWTTSSDALYEIWVYDQMVDGVMGKLLSIQSGTCEGIGYYSVPLLLPVPVTSGDDVIVAVKLTTPDYNYPIAVDISGPTESGACYLSTDGLSWLPIGKHTGIPYDVTVRARIVPETITGWTDVYNTMLLDEEEGALSLLRRYRDEVLVPLPAGKKYVELLYKHSGEVAAIFMENPSLMADAGKLISGLLPEIRDSLEGKEMKLSKKEIANIESLLNRFEAGVSPGLKLAIRKVRMDLRKGKIFKQLGIAKGK